MTEESLDIRWRQRFSNYQKALQNLQQVVEGKKTADEFSNIEEMALIQAFEFTFELGWKTIKDYIEYQGEQAPFPREAIKKAFAKGIIADGQGWLQMILDRNLTVHIYDEAAVKNIVVKVMDVYLPLFMELERFFLHAKQ